MFFETRSTNLNQCQIHSGVIETDVSDHFPIFVLFQHLKGTKKSFEKKKLLVHTEVTIYTYSMKI